METLITILVLVLLSAVSGWLKKRANGAEADESWPPPAPRSPGRPMAPPTPRPTAKPAGSPAEGRPVTRSWEEELRRLLEGDRPMASPPAPPPKAPPIPPARPQPAPPVLVGPARSVVSTPASAPLGSLEGVVAELGELTTTARQQAQRLQGRAATELKRAEAVVARQVTETHVPHREGLTEEISAVRGMLGSSRTARQAVIASVILGPPVGL